MPLSKSPSVNFSVGSIVALNTHPFFQESDNNAILISGDTTTLSPLMIIIETLLESNSPNVEKEGVGNDQCKCIWYSISSGQFEDAWLSTKLLRIIESDIISLENNSLLFGESVILKTISIELGKKKVSLNSDDSSQKSNKVITALLPFTSPVMQVIGFKEPLKDSANKTRKIFSIQLVKCKFYNSLANKFSEVLIPIEALEKIYSVSKNLLDKIKDAIKNNHFYKTSIKRHEFTNTIVKPIRIIYKSGNYYLEADDYLQNKIIEILIKGNEEQFEIIDNKLIQLPAFEVKGNRLKIEWITKENLIGIPSDRYWRIKYKNYNDKVTTRTIYEPSYFFNTIKEDKKLKRIEYVKAKCIASNNEIRYFRIDRIQKLQIIEINSVDNSFF